MNPLQSASFKLAELIAIGSESVNAQRELLESG